MKLLPKLIFILVLFAVSSSAFAQGKSEDNVVIVDDESCGCELVFIDGIQTTRDGDLFGFKKADGTVIVPNKYKFVDKFRDGYCRVMTDYNMTGLIDSTGKELIPCIYPQLNYPAEGLVRAEQNGKVGFLDLEGNVVIDFQYAASSSFNEGLAAVGVLSEDEYSIRYGYINTKGDYVVKPIYDFADPFVNGCAVVTSLDRQGMINHDGDTVVPIKYGFVTAMQNGVFFAGNLFTKKIAMFNKDFKPVTKFIYDDIFYYGEGMYVVGREGKMGYLTLQGKEKIKCQYDYANSFRYGRAAVCRNGKYGIINTKNKVVLPIEYDNNGQRPLAYCFSEGLAMVEKNGKYGFCNLDGKIVIPIQYDLGFYFTEGIAPMKKNGHWGYIDHEGKVKIPFIFDACSYFQYGRAEVVFQGTVHKINPEGKCLKNCKGFPKYE